MSLQSRIEADGVPYVTRAEWGADVGAWRWNHRTRAEPIPMSLPVGEVYMHHSVTIADDDGDLHATDDVAADMREIERIGLNRFGRYSYSFALHPSGAIGEGCGDWIGAHTYGRNSSSFGIVAIGNYETDRVPKALLRSAGILLRALVAEGWTDGVPHIAGHRDVRSTSCPGGYLYAALPDIRGLAKLTPTPSTLPMEDDELVNIYSQIIKALYRAKHGEDFDVALESPKDFAWHLGSCLKNPEGAHGYIRDWVAKPLGVKYPD